MYAFGVMLNEMIAKEPPFNGVPLLEVRQAVLDGKRPDIPLSCPKVRTGLAAGGRGLGAGGTGAKGAQGRGGAGGAGMPPQADDVFAMIAPLLPFLLPPLLGP